jgi:predicted DNA-binding transcriptional regulator AlpA
MTTNTKSVDQTDRLRTPLLTESEAADRLRLKKKTLQRWRWQGSGPAFVKLGSAVRYCEDEISRFIDDRRTNSTSSDSATR